MAQDLREALMIIANDVMVEYELMKKISTEDFLIKYKMFIKSIEKNG